MSYPESVRYLYSLGNELKAGAKFGLERMERLLAALGHPERGQVFVHVAGTNGKGSTCAMIANALCCAGKRVGLYTSPHLEEPTERIQVDGRPVGADEFARLFEVVHKAAEEMLRTGEIDAHPSYFETVTAMAFLHFRETAEIGVIEVGLGGRLDATNVILPRIAAISPVSYDHETFLGSSIESIAGEKAGILKRDVPAVVAPQQPAAWKIIEARAKELDCQLIRVEEQLADGFEVKLAGRHQKVNAATAIAVCRGLGIEEKAIREGLRTVQWPGRLETVSHRPDLVLDGAHNPAGAAALAGYIREFAKGRPTWIVYGAMRDKAIEEVAEQLFPLADRLIVTAPDFPRALRPEAILEAMPHANATVAETVAEAIQVARTAPQQAMVFFTGSLYLVGEARRLLVP